MKIVLSLLSVGLVLTACGQSSSPPALSAYPPQAYPPQTTAPISAPAMSDPYGATTPPVDAGLNNAPTTLGAPRTNVTKSGLRPAASNAYNAPTAPPAPVATAAPAAPKPAVPTESVAEELLRKTRETFDGIENFVAQADVYEKNDEKGAVRGKLKVIFRKPGSAKMEFLEHSVGQYKGVKLTYSSGNPQVQIRAGGVLGFLSLNLPMTDDKVKSRRGYRLDQVDTLAIVDRLAKAGTDVKVLGKTTVGGNEIAVLQYTPINHFDPKITKEMLGIDMKTYFVRIHEMYEGDQLVYSLKIPQVDFDQPLTDADLKV
jgi:outer membrane lipoprotein-sorting protein